MGKGRKGMKYRILKDPQRRVICELKEKGIPHKVIGFMLHGINSKTVQSVRKPEKNSEYMPFVRAVQKEVYNEVINLYRQKSPNEKKLRRIVRKRTRKLMAPQSKFADLIPQNKKHSQRRRIIEKIVSGVVRSVIDGDNNQSIRLSNIETPSISGNMVISEDLSFQEQGQNFALEDSFEICFNQLGFQQHPEEPSQNEFKGQVYESEIYSNSQNFYYDYQ